MPVKLPISLQRQDQPAFSELDYLVMEKAFQCQMELGRLCDEIIYQNDLAARLRACGLSVEKEVPITVSHRDFSRQYWLDLVVANAGIYELKTTTSLAKEHETQLLNYLFLCDSHHGKLVNFRPQKVESKFINATMTLEERRRFEKDVSRWLERDESDRVFYATLIGLLEDWGTCLELPLYLEAISFFLGGQARVMQPVTLARDGLQLGAQTLHLLAPETAFRLTAVTESHSSYERSLSTLLKLSPLKTIQWVNLDRRRVVFTTLSK